MLAGERTDAAVRSEPIDLVVGARYRLTRELALPGDCEILVLGETTAISPDQVDELIAQEPHARIQIRSIGGKKVGLARVSLVPVGPRVSVRHVRDTFAFASKNEPYHVIASVANEGSVPIPAALARFVPSCHKLFEEHKMEQPIGPIPVGESVEVRWSIAAQRRAIGQFRIEVDYGGHQASYEGLTLQHKPRQPEQRLTKSVLANRRVLSLANRGLRITAHETDLDFGPALVWHERHRTALGVLRHLALLHTGEGVIPLFSKFRKATETSVELTGASGGLEWMLFLRPDHFERAIAVEIRVRSRKQIKAAQLDVFPFLTNLRLQAADGGISLCEKTGMSELHMVGTKGLPMQLQVHAGSGTAVLESERFAMAPGTWYRAEAVMRIG